MASSVSSVALVPVSAVYPRTGVLRPVDAGTQPDFDAQALRRAQALQAETLRETSGEQAQEQRPDAAEAEADRGRQGSRGQRPAGDSAPFVAQLLAQDQPPPRRRDPFAEAARAYGRFREEPRVGFVLDAPARIDIRV
jgi:hypothetical protein